MGLNQEGNSKKDQKINVATDMGGEIRVETNGKYAGGTRISLK